MPVGAALSERTAAPTPQRARRERERLARALPALGLAGDRECLDRLLEFAALVRKWNASYNLVGRGDTASLIDRHILDSLALHPFVAPGDLLDVGSGAGFPGLPLAIAMPGLEVTLLDSAGKKTRFLRHVQRTLNLPNVHVEHTRVEAHRPAGHYRNIVCRAFASLAAFATGVRHLAGPETRMLAMKGRAPAAELQDLPGWVAVERVVRLEVPDLHAERHLVIMCVSPDSRLSNDN